MVVAVVAFAWLWWPGADPMAALSNMDVLYQMHRVARCLGDFPRVASVDTYSHAGSSWHVHWPGPHALLLATIARLGQLGPTVTAPGPGSTWP